MNIPLSARKEVESNSYYVQWLNKVAVPECRDLISNSESLLKEINNERQGIAATLDRIRTEHGESEFKTACYNYCNQRMREGYKLEHVKVGYEQQIQTLGNVIKTRQTLIGRNVKLIRQAKQASCLHNQANLTVKTDQLAGPEARRVEAVPDEREPVEHATMAEKFPKPDAPSSIETDKPEQETSGNTQHNKSL